MPRLGTAAEADRSPSIGERAASAISGFRVALMGERSDHATQSLAFIGLGFLAVLLSLMRFMGDFCNLSNAALSPLGFPLLLALDALFIFVYADALPVMADSGGQAVPHSSTLSDLARQEESMVQRAGFGEEVLRGVGVSEDPRKLALFCAYIKCLRLMCDPFVPPVALLIGGFDLVVSTEKFYGLLARGRCSLRQGRLMSSLLSPDAIMFLPGMAKAALVMDLNVEIGVFTGGAELGPVWQVWSAFVLGTYALASICMMAAPAGIGYSVVTIVGLLGIGLNSAQSALIRVLAVALAVGNAAYLWHRHKTPSGSSGAHLATGVQSLGRGLGAAQSLGGARPGQKGNLPDLRQNLLQGM